MAFVFDNVMIGDQFRDKRGVILTVTELTSRGFKYDCTPHHIYPARLGPSLVKNGELFYREWLETCFEPFWNENYVKVENHEQGNRKNWPGQSEERLQEAQQALGSTST